MFPYGFVVFTGLARTTCGASDDQFHMTVTAKLWAGCNLAEPLGACESSVNHHFWVGRAPIEVINVFIYRSNTYTNVLGCFGVELSTVRQVASGVPIEKCVYSEMTPLEMFWRSESNRTMLLQCQSLTLLPPVMPFRSLFNTFKARDHFTCGESFHQGGTIYYLSCNT